MSESYQATTRISLDDVHYAPLSAGECELGIIGSVRGKRTLELACGAAQNSIALAKWGAHATALDMSPRQLAHAKALIAQERVRVDLLQSDMERLSMFTNRSFDLVISCFGLEFLPYPAPCIDECFRVLKDGGLLVLGTVHPLTAFEWDTDAKALWVTDYFNPPVEVWDEPTASGEQKGLTFFRSFQEVFGMLVNAGFQVEQVVEPAPYNSLAASKSGALRSPYGGAYWESDRERLSKIPFAIVYKARKPKTGARRI